MTYFDPHVWEDLSQQQKLKKESEQKNLPSIEKRDFLKFFCNKAVQVQQGRTNFPGPAHFYPSGPIHLSFHHFFSLIFFLLLDCTSGAGRVIWSSCIDSVAFWVNQPTRQLIYRIIATVDHSVLEAWRIHQSLLFLSIEYIYICVCVYVCVC